MSMKYGLTIALFLFSVIGFSQSDTLNRTDADGKRTGYWVIFGKEKPEKGFADSSVIEEGEYDDGKRTGLWKTYYPSGNKKTEIEYKNNRPYGKFITYFENGNKEEEGTWKGSYYIGRYERYDSDGCIMQSKEFTKDGKSIWYVYYYQKEPCGTYKEIEYNLDSSGLYIEYNINGDTTYFSTSEKPWKPIGYGDVKETRRRYTKPEKEFVFIKLQQGDSISDGYNKLYNENKQISEDGIFKSGKLIIGKKYFYDKNGLLDKIEIYKDGKYAGDAQID